MWRGCNHSLLKTRNIHVQACIWVFNNKGIKYLSQICVALFSTHLHSISPRKGHNWGTCTWHCLLKSFFLSLCVLFRSGCILQHAYAIPCEDRFKNIASFTSNKVMKIWFRNGRRVSRWAVRWGHSGMGGGELNVGMNGTCGIPGPANADTSKVNASSKPSHSLISVPTTKTHTFSITPWSAWKWMNGTVIILAALCYAKSLQSCLTLCDPIDGSPPGSPVPGILQARTLEWVAISFSNAWKWKEKVKSLSRIRLLATPWTAAYQAPPSMGFSRQEYWSGVPLPSPWLLYILQQMYLQYEIC